MNLWDVCHGMSDLETEKDIGIIADVLKEGWGDTGFGARTSSSNWWKEVWHNGRDFCFDTGVGSSLSKLLSVIKG